MANQLGLTQIYTGDGKGKTTAAIGLAVRAAGHGWKSRIIQFMKAPSASGETQALKRFSGIDIDRIGSNFIAVDPPSAAAVTASLQPALDAARLAVVGPYDLVILDEIITAVSLKLLEEADVLALINWPERRSELVLTGRGATAALIEAADLVTEMREIKHPYANGVTARPGIEF